MKINKIFYSLVFLSLALTTFGQSTNERIILGRSVAEKQLKEALNVKELPDETHKAIIITDSLKAISIAEPIVFKEYGKKNIIDQRPYESYLINNYWVISGTLSVGYEGGTFVIIIDATNGEKIYLTHYQ